MTIDILNDSRIRAIPWKDLRPLSSSERVRDLLMWVPWLAASWVLAASGLVPLALPLSFVFFLTGLRLVHDVFHHNLGLPRWADELVMVFMSVLMLGSMHAVQYNHLRHHRHCMSDEDVEALSARMPAWRAIGLGPVFPWLLHRAALTGGRPRLRRWVWLELARRLDRVAPELRQKQVF